MGSTPPPLPNRALNYATPVGIVSRFSSVGGQLLASRSCVLPSLCVKCGQTGTKQIQKTVYWHEQWIYGLVIAGIIPYAIVSLLKRQRASITFHFCQKHHQYQQYKLIVTWLSAIMGVMMLGLSLLMLKLPSEQHLRDPALVIFLVGILMLIIFVSLMLILVPVLKPLKMAGDTVWYVGASPDFLRKLPSSDETSVR